MHNRFEAYARIYKTALSGMAREKILKGTIRTAVIRNGNTKITAGKAVSAFAEPLFFAFILLYFLSFSVSSTCRLPNRRLPAESPAVLHRK